MDNQESDAASNQLMPRVPIRVAQLGELNAYIIYEHELDALDRLDTEITQDAPDSVYLNFALFLLPIAMSFLITLLTTKIASDRVYTVFLVITVLCFIISLILFALWRRDRHSYRQKRQQLAKKREKCIMTIKNRLPPNPTLQPTITFSKEQL